MKILKVAGWRDEAKTGGGMRDLKSLFWTLCKYLFAKAKKVPQHHLDKEKRHLQKTPINRHDCKLIQFNQVQFEVPQLHDYNTELVIVIIDYLVTV